MLLAKVLPGGLSGLNDEAVVMILALAAAYLFVYFVLEVFYLLTLSKALSQCSPRNRTMEPGMVWLQFIPCFNLVWGFIVVNRISESLTREFYERRLPRQGDFGKGLGITMLVVWLAAAVINNVVSNDVPIAGLVVLLLPFVFWLVYWVKIAGFNRILAEGGYPRGEDEDRPRYGRGDDFDRPGGRELGDDYGDRFGDRDRKRGEERYPERRDDDEGRFRDR